MKEPSSDWLSWTGSLKPGIDWLLQTEALGEGPDWLTEGTLKGGFVLMLESSDESLRGDALDWVEQLRC